MTLPTRDFDDASPDPSAMIESLRAYGYTLPTAIADLVDNSIAAHCRTVWLGFHWDEAAPWISVLDDGGGMSEQALISAMRLGSRSPVEARDPADLGRFGLGLKTASFSQARRLTVISRSRDGTTSQRRWDLDHLARPDISGWQLLRTLHEESTSRVNEIHDRDLEHGTQVLLEVLDRIMNGSGATSVREATEDHFVRLVQKVREHLGMIFHRFLTDKPSKRIRILINEDDVKAWDPFVEGHPATEGFPPDSFPAGRHTEMFKDVQVRGFVLPHRDRFDELDPSKSLALHREAGGPAGWNAQQGFYLYRNRRLIIAGDWLGLGPGSGGWKKEEHFKLARIRVDIPNSMDHEWQIDVKKSTALAPPALREWLQGLAKTVRERAKQVYAHRGRQGARRQRDATSHATPWVQRSSRAGTFSYGIDRRNPLLGSLIRSLPAEASERLETLLRLVEETVPVQRIWIDTAENQDGVAKPFESERRTKLRDYIRIIHTALCDQGSSSASAWDLIATCPAFLGSEAQAIIGQLKGEYE